MKEHFVEIIDINNKLVSFDEVYGEYKSECFCLALNSDFEQHIVVEGDRDCVLRFTDKIKSLVFDKELYMKTFKLLDYTAQVFYNKDQHYPFCLHLYDNYSGKQLHVGYYVSVEQLCYMTHLEMLEHQYHALNPVKTLFAIEEMKESLYLLVHVMGEE